jgi:glucose-6-phosphate-specific signal transduction histidine kinase
MVTATVPAQSFTDIKTPNQDGTVRAVVASIDLTTNQTKVVTDAGQTLVLAMAHQTLAGLQVGDAFTLTVSPQGDLTAVVSPRGEIAEQR